MKTKVWAHRGASGWDKQYAPENTMPAFQKAIEMGADGIELDVQLTRDKEIVIIHDETIDRVSDHTGWVKDYSLAELKKMNFNKTHLEYNFTEIPTLKEFFQFILGNSLLINIELKTGLIFYEGLEEKVLVLADEMNIADRIIYSSFNHSSLQKIKALAPLAKTGVLFTDGFIHVPTYAKRLGAYSIHPAQHILKYPGFIKECHEKGLKINAWTVDNKVEMKNMCKLGIDGFITDCPDSGRRMVDGRL